VTWLAAISGGASERQALLDAARQCWLAQAAFRGQFRVFRPADRR